MESIQSEGPGKLAVLAKCAHPDCTCTLTDGQRYCSDYCAQIAQSESANDHEGCNCGHPECTADMGVPIAPVATLVS